MLLRILQETFRRRKRRMVAAILAVLVGSSLSAALLTVSSDVSDKMTREMRAYGANILIAPQDAEIEVGGTNLASASRSYVDENELIKLKTIFWRNNILGFAPYLSLLVSTGKSEEQFVLTGTWFEKDLVLPAGTKVKSTFAGQNTTSGSAPFKTGIKMVAPWWRVEGSWVADGDRQGALVGTTLAERLSLHIGDTFTVKHDDKLRQLKVAGIVRAGG
ncbi:MAG: ABC transporter permease, partial [Chloroflexi bacterium]|nr:ABC transporter permease [Chloroflexota bacterium]